MRTRPPETPPRRSLLLALLGILAAAAPAVSQAPDLRPLVVIDAGHGGADPGALGPGGTREKDVTLAIARELATILRATPGLEVRMTRDRDTLIALRDRPRLANRWRGAVDRGRRALFISVHANAHRDPATRGFETYFLSEARTEEARRVEAMENAAVEYEAVPTSSDVLGFILNDLRQNLYLRESSEWAAIVQSRLAAAHAGPDRGVKQAGFVVLDGAFMPAVLVEVGFITNRGEEARLSARDFQRRVAGDLATAVRDFLSRGSSARTAGYPAP